MSRDDILGYWKRRYGAGSMVVAAAGSTDHEAVVEMVAERFGDWSGDTVEHEYGEAARGRWSRSRIERRSRPTSSSVARV